MSNDRGLARAAPASFFAADGAGWRGIVLAALLLAPVLSRAATPPTVFESGEAQTTLLEVFSSEGCSSCPPAEIWLSRQESAPGLWTEVVPVCFHVDYWDALGWKDPYGSRAASDRQRAYARNGRAESVYTPGFFVNGREWKGWFRGNSVLPRASAKPGPLKVALAGDGTCVVEFRPADPAARGWTVHALVEALNLESRVTAGENRGRVLHHDFVALHEPVRHSLARKGDRFVATFRLPPALRAAPTAAVFWITAEGDALPVQATGGFLPDAPAP